MGRVTHQAQAAIDPRGQHFHIEQCPYLHLGRVDILKHLPDIWTEVLVRLSKPIFVTLLIPLLTALACALHDSLRKSLTSSG